MCAPPCRRVGSEAEALAPELHCPGADVPECLQRVVTSPSNVRGPPAALVGPEPGIAGPEMIAAKRPFAACGRLTPTFY
jgi:hypothetical protein